jgi:hypothetical protein
MKALFALLLMFSGFNQAAHADVSSVQGRLDAQGLFCSMDYLPDAFRWVDHQGNDYDKFKHCAVSCFLTLRCSSAEVLIVGALKEFKDLFDDGNAEMADLDADRYGIRLVTDQRATYDAECSRQCGSHYPKR